MEDFFANKAFISKPPDAQMEEFSELVSDNATPAHYTWIRLRKIVKNFEKNLDSEHELMFTFVSLNKSGLTQVENISYWSPDLLIFECRINNVEKAILVQHYTQLNFLISSQKKDNPNTPARRIGFNVVNQDRDDNESSHSQSQ